MNRADHTSSPGDRVISVDALRGFDMFWITGGNQVFLALAGLFVSPLPDWLKYQLEHPRWEGFSAWDVIMPLFLFIVGVAMPFAFARRLEAGQSPGQMYGRIIRRVLVLWVLGMMAQGNLLEFNLSTLHPFSNTLQAIAVGYLVAGIALLHLSAVGQVGLAVLLLVGYWLLMMLVPVPGHSAGLLEEHTNLAMYIDEMVLGRFRDGTTYTWILGSMGFAGMVLCGVFAGHLLRSRWSGAMKVVWLVLLSLLSLALGWFWAGGFDQMLDVPLVGAWRFPIIKHLFTSSMVLWAAGWCYLLMAVFYLIMDVLGFRKCAFFFVVIGANPIFAYMIVRFVDFSEISSRLVGGLARNLGNLGAFGQSLGTVLLVLTAYALLWLLLWYMYRKGTMLRV